MIRENINQFLENGDKILYVPKNGGLCDYVLNMLPEIGIPLEGKIKKDTKVGDIYLKLARGEDIPRLVEEQNKNGKLTYGLTGDDLFDEFRLKKSLSLGCVDSFIGVLTTYDWFDEDAMNKRPSLYLMNKSGSAKEIKENSRIAINQKYKLTSKRFLEKTFPNMNFIINAYYGGTEETISEGINDVGIDIVYGGTSIKDNSLKLIGDPVRTSDISLIGIKDIWAYEFSRIEDRVKNPTNTYTSKLLKDENELVKKISSECGEFIKAYLQKENLSGETADLIYATMAVLASSGVKWFQIENEIMNRWRK